MTGRIGYSSLLDRRREVGARTLTVGPPGLRAAVVSGADGARVFYDESVMRRRGAIPLPLRRVLFGVGAIHGLDGADHEHRKALFVDVLTPAAAKAIAELADERWRKQAGQPVDPVGIFDEAVQVHAGVIFEWAGVPQSWVYDRLPRHLIDMVDGFGSLGPRYVQAYRARRRIEKWARDLIAAVRDGQVSAAGTVVEAMATYRGRDGKTLPARVAGVELLNVLRPTVAVAYFVAFTADALAADPLLRDRLREGHDDLVDSLAHEVRRYYPFVPVLAAKVDRPTEHDGCPLRRNRRVLLDVYGTLHDPEIWSDPDRFEADRFVGVELDPWTYYPHGAGDPAAGHRCPGERVTLELIKSATRHLVVDRPPVTERAPYRLDRIPSRPLR